jgi:hypothetical protein
MKALPNYLRALVIPGLIGAAVIFTMEAFVMANSAEVQLNQATYLFTAAALNN